MIYLLIILAMLNGFSIGVFLFENHGQLTKKQWLVFASMIFIGVFILLGFILLHAYFDYKDKVRIRKQNKQ